MALQHEVPLQSVLKFFSVPVIPASCDNSQKPMSVSEEELEKGHLAPEPEKMLLLGKREDLQSWAMGRASSSLETHARCTVSGF